MLTSKQISALKYMIFNAKKGTDLSKRVLAFLIEKSEGMTKEVCLTLVAEREGYTADDIQAAELGVGYMESGNGTTHLHELLTLMGSELDFSVHYGDFDPTRRGDPFNTDGQFAGWSGEPKGMPLRYTFWLSMEDCSQQATLVVATREELEQINLKKPGLYTNIESA